MRRKAFYLVLAAFLMLVIKSDLRAESGVYYHARSESLFLVLYDLAQASGLRFKRQDEDEDFPSALVSGNFHLDNLESLLDDLSSSHHFDWYVQNRELLIFSPKRRRLQTYAFKSPRDRLAFRQILEREAPLKGTRFPITNKNENALAVAAPQSYQERIAELHAVFSTHGAAALSGGKGKSVMLFPLKYAWAADKSYQFEEGAYIVPGVASMLRKLTGAGSGGKGADPIPVMESPSNFDRVEPLEKVHQSAQSAADDKTDDPKKKKTPQQTGATILADPRLNSILINDDLEKRAYYESLIEKIDQKTHLIHIEVIIVDVEKSRLNDLGISWRGQDKRGNSGGYGALGESVVADGAIGLSWGLGGVATAMAANAYGLLAKIRIMESRGQSRIISRPSIMTMNNLEARINSNQRYFLKVEGFQDSSLYPINVGTTLRVTPHVILGDGEEKHRIQLFVAVEDGVIDRSDSSQIGELPRIQENRVQTQAIVSEGGSLLIGGHVHSMVSRSHSRIPILGDIPLLGYFFRNSSVNEREFVRLFVIRPHMRS